MSQNVNLKVCLDLGSDTLKIAFGYLNSNGSPFIGKMYYDKYQTNVAYPACALYDEEKKEWIFSAEIEDSFDKNYYNVVKIKTLFSLLNYKDSTKDYFYQNYFPKFLFQDNIIKGLSGIKINNTDNTCYSYQYMVNNDMTFSSNKSINELTIAFFKYVYKEIKAKIAQIIKDLNISYQKIEYIVLYPSYSSELYINTLQKNIETAFSTNVSLMVNQTKALAANAYYNGAIVKNDNILIVDLGEEKISVVMARSLGAGAVVVDSIEEHLLPLDCGGEDFDLVIANRIEQKANTLTALGADIVENSVTAKEYNFIKDIKTVKRLLSENINNSSFISGTNIILPREVDIDVKVTYDDLLEWTGINSNDEKLPAPRILNYVIKELSLPACKKVNKVFFAGGLIESYGLLEYLVKNLNKHFPNISCKTFKHNVKADSNYIINSNIESTYAASVGGLYINLKNYSVYTSLSLSYGTYFNCNEAKSNPYRNSKKSGNAKFLNIFVDKGSTADTMSEFEFFMAGAEAEEYIYSTTLTKNDIENHIYENKLTYEHFTNGDFLKITNYSDDNKILENVLEYAKLKVVYGGKIYFYYKNQCVSLNQRVMFVDGIRINEKLCQAEPYIRNNEPKLSEKTVSVVKYDIDKKTTYGPSFVVNAREIEPRLLSDNTKVDISFE